MKNGWASLFCLSAIYLISSPLLAQDPPPSIEQLLDESTRNARAESARIAGEVRSQLAVFRMRGNQAPPAHAQARTKLAEMGFGAVPFLIDTIKKSDDEGILEQIGLTLLEMHERKTASTTDIGRPLRDLIDAKQPLHSATAIAVLGAIGDQDALDAIRLQLERGDNKVKAAVLLALARLGDDNCFAALEKESGNDDRAIRNAVAQAYGIVGRNPQDQKIMVALTEDPDDEVALAAIRSLERISLNSRAMATLHETLKNDNPRFVEIAIEVIERINKKDYSARHLMTVVKNDKIDFELRTTAAKALFRMGDSAGMNELSKGYKAAIRNEPRRSGPYERLAEYYADFGAWEACAKAYEKAIDRTNNGSKQSRMQLEIARCWARDGKFKKAAAALKKTPRGTAWQDLLDDPAFAEMREDKRYRKNFYR